jgi:branched-chain amino acid transport system ATP-binding protein
MSDTLLKLEGVHTHIGQYHILQGVDLAVPRGALTVLLGRNGAGKTTTLRTIMGLWQRSRGRITFDGRDIGGLATPDIAQGGVAYVPETMAVFSDLTVAENMRLAARHAPPDPARLDWIFGFFPALRKFWHFPAGVLSGGQKQMLSIARAVVEPRSLILVDEPTKGIAPAIIENMIHAFAEQNFRFAAALGDSVAVMDDGRIVHTGTMAELAGDAAMQTRLLGLSLGEHQ